jgi:lambda family phage portal protein
VPAEGVLHVFKPSRPGQVRGPSWFAPVLLRFKDFDEFEDATLMKQKIAACLAVLTTDTDGTAPGLGVVDPQRPTEDYLEPGIIKQLTPGQTVEVVSPPPASDYDEYSRTVLRAIATGLGVTYEDLTGDYEGMPFSAARMSRLRHEARVYDWRWRILIPQFCDPVWAWFVQVASIVGLVPAATGDAVWTPPPLASVDPDKEGAAANRLIRNGLKTWSETIRESGQDPNDVAQELADDLARFDRLGLKLDCDARQTTQQGQSQSFFDDEDQSKPQKTTKQKDAA